MTAVTRVTSFSGYDLRIDETPLKVAQTLVDEFHLTERPIVLNITDKMKSDDCFTVYVDMVGDLFHAGHQNLCRQAILEAKKMTGKEVRLIIGLCSDEDCEGYKRKPMNTLAERVAAAAGCRFVDAVLIPAPLVVTKEVMENCKVDLVVHGDDFTPEKHRKYYGVPMDMGKYKTVPYTEGISTSELIKRIQARAETT